MRARAFTLLEVMVAIAILGLALTVILSAQTGLYSSSGYAQRVSIATGLARCRMTEIEERLLKLGFPELEEKDEGACCDGESRQDFTCKWKIDKILLPNATLSASGDGGVTKPGLDLASNMAGGTGPGMGGLGALGGLLGGLGAMGAPGGVGATGTGSPFSLGPSSSAGPGFGDIGDGGVPALGNQLQQGAGIAAGLAPMAMSLVYPMLKPMLEASIRKITVSVGWREGIRDRDLTIVQYLTHPNRGGFMSGGDGGVNPLDQILKNLPAGMLGGGK